MLNLPLPIQAGDTLIWTDSVSLYLASQGWTLKYRLVGPAVIDIVSTASGDDHAFTVAATDTVAYLSGDYQFQAYVVNVSNEQHTVGSGSVEVIQNLITTTTPQEGRTFWQQLRDALQAMVLGRATKEQEEMQIAGRLVRYLAPRDVHNWLLKAEHEVAREQRKQDEANGKRPSRVVGNYPGPPL